MKARFPKGMTIGLIIGGDLLLLVLGWFLLISPQRSTAASIAHSTQSVQVQIQAYQQEAAAAAHPVVPKQPPIRTATLYELAKAMPFTMDMPDVLLELDQVARDAGVTVSSITPGADSAGTSFTVVPITVTFSGNWYTLTDLLYRLRTLVTLRNGELAATGRLFSVSSVALSPGGTGNTLTAIVAVNTFIYGIAGATVTTPDTAPASTSTDTTSTDTTTTAAADVAP
jgi:Tfp pilus assembly protein PilO